jgi:hypothetical protein
MLLELDRIELLGQRDDPDPLVLGSLERGEQALLELEAVGDHEVRLTQERGVGGARLVRVRVHAGRHQDLDPCVVADEGRRDVAEDRGGGHDERLVAVRGGRVDIGHGIGIGGRVARVRRLGATTGGEDEGADREQCQQGPCGSGHAGLRSIRVRVRVAPVAHPARRGNSAGSARSGGRGGGTFGASVRKDYGNRS